MNKQSKSKYQKPNVDLIKFSYEDIITSSDCPHVGCVFVSSQLTVLDQLFKGEE